VRTLGDIAVANGTYVLHHKPDQARWTKKGVFTHVFEKTHGGWVCINSQRTKLPKTPAASTKSLQRRDAFPHPFIGKGDKGSQ